jgi:hypothetical protein
LNDWCLDIGRYAATTPPAPVAIINPCNGSNSQRWVFNSAGQIESMYSPGYCLSIDGPWDGAAVGLTACQGFGSTGDRELWTHQANGQVTSAVGPCLAIWGGQTVPATFVIGYHCTADTPGQEWDSAS